MDAADLRARIEADYAEALDLLGSRDLLVALSGGEPRSEPLLRAAAASEYAARETFREWADTAADDALRETYAAVAAREDDHLRRVRECLDEPRGHPPDGPGPMHAYLRGREEPIHRVAGGMVGRTLVSLRTHGALLDFFEGRDADAEALLRALRAETADCLDDGLDVLDARAGGEDWDAALAVAGYTVRLAADDLRDA
ncbi:rubrerythrin family protein [Haloplanus halophilus]|uniref:rubrerythrin family protein n=1 Tax=Haloplanus halophilus TaxID=2949993 RepID=UPI00203DE785|nr:rubrerythrin family protein [Haloplanus sp. GDY1]